jgi:SAM-dependent methyltransferase
VIATAGLALNRLANETGVADHSRDIEEVDMVAVTVNFAGTIPEYYDRCLGPAYFSPFAAELARRIPAESACDVLEIACGTGLVTQCVRQRMRPGARLVATDLSAAMIDHARTKLADAAGVEWREANAQSLPFADASFGVVVCGFGMMFVPDKVVALKEARRVLVDGGTIHFTVWDAIEENPHAAAAAEVIEGLAPGDAELRFRVPYELRDPALVRGLLAQAGFVDVRIEIKRLPIEADSARSLAIGAIRGTPRSAVIEHRGIALDGVIDKLAERLAEAGGASPYRGHAQALIVDARKGP